MEQKIKFIIIGLVGFCIICLFLFIQAASQQQSLIRQSNDLKSENTSLVNKANKLENDLRDMQSKIGSLKSERDKGIEDLNELQKRYDSAAKARDELIEKLKQKSQEQPAAPVVVQPVQSVATPVIQNNDAYWGTVLKDKADLEIQLSSVQVELKNLQISNEALQRQKSILELDINSLRNEKKDLLRQLDYNQKLLDSMSQDVVREKNDKGAIQDGLKTLRIENDSLARQLKSLVSRKELLDKKVQGLTEGKSTAEKRLSEMEAMLTDRISKIDALKNELDAIKSGKTEVLDKEPKESVELPAIVVRSAVSTEKTKAQIQEFPGKILAVNLDSNFVVIDLGSSSGAKVGDIFNVYRAAKSIGSISVIQTRTSISACDIRKMNTPFKIGDNVK
jgi:predicted  nucleic acid-binding Zn-ribbon protein